MASLKDKADAASEAITKYTAEIEHVLTSKRDKTLSAATNETGHVLAPLRCPPQQVKCRRKLYGHFGKVTALDWSADGKTIVSASQDGNLLLWDAFSTNKKQDVKLKSNYVMSVCMEQTTGQYVAAGGLDNTCTIYQVGGEGSGKLKAELVSHDLYLADCKFFHSPSKMLTASADFTALLWDVERGTILETFAEHTAGMIKIELVGSTSFLSTSIDQTIKLWDTRSSAKNGSVQTFTGHTADVNGLTVLPTSNGTTFATCSEDGTVRVWDCRSYGQVAQFGTPLEITEQDPFQEDEAGFTSITASASGRLVFCGHSEGIVECYDILSGSKDPTYTLSNAHETYVSCVRVSPTGEVLCTGSWDTQLKLFG